MNFKTENVVEAKQLNNMYVHSKNTLGESTLVPTLNVQRVVTSELR